MPLIVGFDGLRFRQPPNRIGTLRVGCCLDAFTSIEAFQPEVESIKGTQELAEFFPSVLAPIHDDRRRAFSLIDSSVYRSTVQIESILTGPGAWKIGGAKVSYRQTGLYLLVERGIRLVRFDWPLAKTQRAHIHGIIDSCDLPVRHTTRRTGRPFTLLLEKTAGIFERDATTDRRSWQNDLQWLKGTTADF